jgi:DNA-binding NarL/FixJ family response regulator
MRNDSAPLTGRSSRWIQVAVMHAEAGPCDALCDAISDAGGFHVIGTARNGADALVLMETLKADVIVLDLASIGAEAAGLLLASRARSPRTGILLLANEQERGAVDDLVARGAGGFVDTALLATQLAPALRTIGMGRRYVPVAAAGAP